MGYMVSSYCRTCGLFHYQEEWPSDCIMSRPSRYKRVSQDSLAEPIRGADGKMHDSLSSYRNSLKPSGNPQGERYIEIGNEKLQAAPKPQFDRGKRRDDIKRTMNDIKYGNIPSQTG